MPVKRGVKSKSVKRTKLKDLSVTARQAGNKTRQIVGGAKRYTLT